MAQSVSLSTDVTGAGVAFRAVIYRKIGWRILPLLILSYGLAYIDRVNISFAKLQMQGDLGLSDTAYGFGAGVFFRVMFCWRCQAIYCSSASAPDGR